MIKIIYVTYAINIRGGIEIVNRMFKEHFNNLVFHYSINVRNNIFNYFAFSVIAYFKYLYRLIILKPKIAHILIASRIDFIRNMPYILISRMIGLKTLIQFRTSLDWSYFSLPSPLRYIIKLIIKKTDLIAFLGKTLEREFLDGVCRMPSIVIPNPITKEYFGITPLPYNQRHNKIIYLGRYSQDKGIYDLAEAAKKHVAEDKNIYYKCHGDGKYLKEKIERFKLSGWIEGIEKIELIRTAKILVLPSYFEGFPNVLLEAMALGTPVVATRVGSTPDIVTDNVNGKLIEPGDINGLYNAIRRLSDDKLLWQKCSENSINIAKEYNPDKIFNMWKIVYETLADSDDEANSLTKTIIAKWSNI